MKGIKKLFPKYYYGVKEKNEIRRPTGILDNFPSALWKINNLSDFMGGKQVLKCLQLTNTGLIEGPNSYEEIMSQPLFLNPQEGMNLFGVIKHLNQEKINRFASISGGTGRIHVDPEYGRKTKFQSTLAHGILLIAYLSEMMKNNFGKPWFISGDMEVRFVSPAKPGDTLICGGKVQRIQNKTQVSCLIWVENQRGEKLAEGNAELNLES